jgi:hypothetical protein
MFVTAASGKKSAREVPFPQNGRLGGVFSEFSLDELIHLSI